MSPLQAWEWLVAGSSLCLLPICPFGMHCAACVSAASPRRLAGLDNSTHTVLLVHSCLLSLQCWCRNNKKYVWCCVSCIVACMIPHKFFKHFCNTFYCSCGDVFGDVIQLLATLFQNFMFVTLVTFVGNRKIKLAIFGLFALRVGK